MILVIAVLTILLLIACALIYAKHNEINSLNQKLFEETGVNSQLRNEKHHEWERANIAEEKIISLKTDLNDLKLSFKNLVRDDNDFGASASWSRAGIATSQNYLLVFCTDPNGQKILNDLERFKQNPFSSDERETCRKIGRMEVYDFILNRINQARNPNYSEQLEIAYMEQDND